MNYDLILKNGSLVTPVKTVKTDISVKDGKIVFIGKIPASDTAGEVFNAEGLHILPGIIDAHVHFRDPGLTEKEDFETGSAAAAFGGVTCVADMPNTIPVTSTVERFMEKVSIAGEKSFVDFAVFALLNNGNLNEMEGLKKEGALGFKVFLGSSTGDIASPSLSVLTEQLQESARLDMRVGFHCETSELNRHFTSLWEKKTETPAGIILSRSRPVFSEALAVHAAVCYAQYLNVKIHIHHITSKDAVILVSEARQKGINLTAETCPHYLLFNESNSAHKVYPPIRGEEQRKALWDALKEKTIDMLATDHAPHTAFEKALPAGDAPAGLSGVETFVPLMLNEVNKGRLSLNGFARLASEKPAKTWGIFPQKGNLAPGADADFTIVDMDKKLVIDAGKLHSKSKTSPYDGMEVKGAVTATVVRGKFVMRDNGLTGKRGYGRLIKPACE